MSVTLILIMLLSVKHFLFDYPFQTTNEISYKGRYADWRGMLHSAKHGVGTALVLVFFTTPLAAFGLACLDFLTHYHIDWAKVQLTRRVAPHRKAWWVLFGLDQLAHTLMYLAFIWLIKG